MNRITADSCIGKKFGKLLVIKKAEKKSSLGETYLLCRCDCGNEKEILTRSVSSGKTKSCGCLKVSASRERMLIHGMSRSSLDSIKKGMLYRCYGTKCKHYKNYGGRGIRVCDEWRYNPTSFFEWAEKSGYVSEQRLSIERIDVNGNYCPENCKWIPLKEQGDNRRNTKRFDYKGELLTLTQISKITGIAYATLACRITRYGWSEEDAFYTPTKTKSKLKFITFNGTTKTTLDWSKQMKIDHRTICKRLKKNLSVEEVLKPTPFSKIKVTARETDEG